MLESKLIRAAILLVVTMCVIALGVRLWQGTPAPVDLQQDGPEVVALEPAAGERFVPASVVPPPKEPTAPAFVPLLEARQARDRELWQPEEDAQRHEAVVVALWDRLRERSDGLEFLAGYDVAEVHLPRLKKVNTELPLAVKATQFSGEPQRLQSDQWREKISGWRRDGWRLVESEWHQPTFRRLDAGTAESILAVVGHLQGAKGRRLILRCRLRVTWNSVAATSGVPVVRSVFVESGTWHEDPSAQPLFEPMAVLSPEPPGAPTAMPIIVEDFNDDGRPDVAAVGNNLLFVNQGEGKFESRALCQVPLLRPAAAAMADFTGDGVADLLVCQSGGGPMVYEGSKDGFVSAARDAGAKLAGMRYPMCITVGDVDADGDLDAWIGQYKPAYVGGVMPTPFYDALDGSPASLLINQGDGLFVDGTEAAGLAPKRTRRTYSASLVDLDADGDLDLLVISDYAGVDLYLNNGNGVFSDGTKKIGASRSLFGMGHCFADFDSDGKIDFYVTGMSSTTARRLTSLGLNRDDFPDYAGMRDEMAYGNRMYLNRGGGVFAEPAYRDAIARTGWSWGVVARDWNADGNMDLYIGNGHFSGRSCKDYCTTFWRHDIYEDTASKEARRATVGLFDQLFRQTQRAGMSWNGFEHNALLMNRGGGGADGYVDLGYIAGVGFEFDSRAVAAADFDGDGLEDVAVVEVVRKRQEGPTPRERIRLYRNTATPPAVRELTIRAETPGVSGVLVTNQRKIAFVFVLGDSFRAQQPLVQRFHLLPDEGALRVYYRTPGATRDRVVRADVDVVFLRH